MNKEEKVLAVEELRAALSTAPAMVLGSHAGIPVNTVNDLRGQLRAVGAHYAVVKNTLARRALAGTEAEALGDKFVGPTAVAWHPEDAQIVAKTILEFAKKNDKYVVKAGYLMGSVFDAKGVEAMSTMPGKDQLRAQLLNLFNAAGTSFVRVLIAGPQSFAYVLNARKDALEN